MHKSRCVTATNADARHSGNMYFFPSSPGSARPVPTRSTTGIPFCGRVRRSIEAAGIVVVMLDGDRQISKYASLDGLGV